MEQPLSQHWIRLNKSSVQGIGMGAIDKGPKQLKKGNHEPGNVSGGIGNSRMSDRGGEA